MKTTVYTCDRCGKRGDASTIVTFMTENADGTRIPHEVCLKGCMQEVGIAILNIIDKKGKLSVALNTLWDSLTRDEKILAIEIALKSNIKQEHDDDAEGDEKPA
jgi:hypothetical protein